MLRNKFRPRRRLWRTVYIHYYFRRVHIRVSPFSLLADHIAGVLQNISSRVFATHARTSRTAQENRMVWFHPKVSDRAVRLQNKLEASSGITSSKEDKKRPMTQDVNSINLSEVVYTHANTHTHTPHAYQHIWLSQPLSWPPPPCVHECVCLCVCVCVCVCANVE